MQDYFQGKTVTKQFLTSKQSQQHMSFEEEIGLSPQVIALYDMTTEPDFPGNAVVFDKEYGVYITQRTTKQLMNDYLHNCPIDMRAARMILKYNELNQRRLPVVLGNAVYLPMKGPCRNITDWVGLHWQDDWHQSNKQYVNFHCIHGYELEFKFSKCRDISNWIHDSCLYGEFTRRISEIIASELLYEIKASQSLGLLLSHQKCNCQQHRNLPTSNLEAKKFLQGFQDWTLEKIHHASEFELPPETVNETMKHLRWFLDSNHYLR